MFFVVVVFRLILFQVIYGKIIINTIKKIYFAIENLSRKQMQFW